MGKGCRMDLCDLPIQYQEQATSQMYKGKQPVVDKPKPKDAQFRDHKYGAKKEILDGHKFDSKLEANCYKVLKSRDMEFTMQEVFTLQEAFKDGEKTIRAITYRADFHVKYAGRGYIVDSKGMETPEFKLKRKILLYKGIRIICVHSMREMKDLIGLIKMGRKPDECEDFLVKQRKDNKRRKKGE
jgi:hypothetical protein